MTEELTEAGSPEGGTIYYAVVEKGAGRPAAGAYNASLPTAADAGEYDIYYYVKGDANHEDTGSPDTPQGPVTAEISRKAIDIRADDKTRSVGADNPAFTYTVTGLTGNDKAEDVLEGELSCKADRDTPMGEKADITQGTLAVRQSVRNYKIGTFTNGTLTITAPVLNAATLQYSDLTKDGVVIYGSAEPSVFATSTYISGAGFEYRKKAESSWTAIEAEIAPSFKAGLTGLTEDTDYEYRAFIVTGWDKAKIYGEVIPFHTLKPAPAPEPQPEAEGKISVTVTRDEKNTEDTREIIVTIEQGNDVIASRNLGKLSETAITCDFDHLPAGNYNVVCRTADGDFKETKLLSVKSGESVKAAFTVVKGQLATLVKVKGSDTPKVAVGGLGSVLTSEDREAAETGQKDIEIRFETEKKDEGAEGVSEMKDLLTDRQSLVLIIDMTLLKITKILDGSGNVTDTQTDNIGASNDKVIEIAIPYSDIKDKLVIMLRYHGGSASKLRRLSSRPESDYEDGTFYADTENDYIFLYASGFSTYAVGFEDDGKKGDDDDHDHKSSGHDSGSSDSSENNGVTGAAGAAKKGTGNTIADITPAYPGAVQTRVPKTDDNLPDMRILILLLMASVCFSAYMGFRYKRYHDPEDDREQY